MGLLCYVTGEQSDLERATVELDTLRAENLELTDQLAETQSGVVPNDGEASTEGNVANNDTAAAVTSKVAARDKTIKALKVDLKAARADVASLKKDGEQTESAMREKVQSLEQQLAQFLTKNEELESQIADNDAASREKEDDSKEHVHTLAKECSALKIKGQQQELAIARLDTQLQRAKEAHANTKKTLSSATAGASQNTMLELELADFKRTADSQSARIAELEEELEVAQNKAGEAKVELDDFQEQLSKQEQGKSKEDDHRQKLKALLRKARSELNENRSLLDAKIKSEEGLRAQLEAQTQKVESLKDKLTEVTVGLNAAESSLRESASENDLTLRSLKFDRETAQRDLEAAKAALAEKDGEFQSYKTRVHTVLKQKKTSEEPVEDTSAPVKKELAALQQKYEEQTADLEELRATCDEYETECDELSKKHAASVKEMSRIKQMGDAHAQQLQLSLESLEQEHAQTLSQLRMDHNMLVRSQKEQLETLQRETGDKIRIHNELVASLRAQVRELTERDVAASRASSSVPRSATSTASLSEDTRRATESFPGRTSGNITPRNSSAEPARAQSMIPDLAGLLSGVQPHAPRESVVSPHEAEISSLKSQIQHLSQLLAESEQGVEMHQEQSKVLKQEIRRHENNTERAEVSANLEYLKNVILKFIGAADERESLIPAIGMLLHFSKDELKDVTKKYKAVVAAQMQKASEDSGGGWLGGWSA